MDDNSWNYSPIRKYSTMKKGTNSVLTPPAQITKLCYPGYEPVATTDSILLKLTEKKALLGVYYYLYLFQYRTGARISEVLNLKVEHISSKGQILIIGLKRSSDRVVFVEECKDYFLKCRLNNMHPFDRCNRFSAYRHLKSMGISKLKAGRKKESVTHIFRDLHVKDVRETKANARTTSNSIGHKSIVSTEYYGKD